jgi:hypothetical protein
MAKIGVILLFCISFWIYSNATSLYLQLGDKCEVDREPITRNSINETEPGPSCDTSIPLECLNGRCNCKRGYTISRNGTNCLEIARNGLESLCEESIQCWKSLLGRLSECLAEAGKCRCYESETLPIVFHQGR